MEVLPLPGTSWRERQRSAAAPGGCAALAQCTSAIYRGSSLGPPKPSSPSPLVTAVQPARPYEGHSLGLSRERGQHCPEGSAQPWTIVTESQNGLGWKGPVKLTLFQPMGRDTFHSPRLLQAPSNLGRTP